jgi:hypothetical protein
MITAIANRPWIWIIVAYIAMIAVMITFVIISIKYEDKDVPVPRQKIDY